MGAGVIDTDYWGIIHVLLFNLRVNEIEIFRADVVHLNLSDTRTDASDLKRTKPSGTSAHKR